MFVMNQGIHYFHVSEKLPFWKEQQAILSNKYDFCEGLNLYILLIS